MKCMKLRVMGAGHVSGERGNSHSLSRIMRVVGLGQWKCHLLQLLGFAWMILPACLIFSCPTSIDSAEIIDLEVLLELDPLDWSSIATRPVIDQCTTALANKQKLKELQVSRLYLLRGTALILVGRAEEAVRDLTELLKSHPNDCQALRFRGIANCLLGKYDNGRSDFESLVKLQPESAIGHAYLALCLIERGHKDDGKKCAEKAIALDQDEPQGYMVRAKVCLLDSNYKQAVKDLNQCIALCFGNGLTTAKASFGLRATVFLNFFDDTKRALPDLLMARRFDPDDVVVRGMFCEYYFKTGRYKMAFHLSEQFPKGQNCPLGLLCNKVNCLLERNRHDEAMQVAESMIKRAPPWWGGYLSRGKVFFAQSKYMEALQDFDKGLSIRREHIGTMASKAYLLATCPEAKFRDGPAALSLARKCCENTEYQVPRQLMLLAMACAECGDYNEAVRWSKKSLEKADPGFPFLEDYRQRLALFEKGKPYRFSPGTRVFDYLFP